MGPLCPAERFPALDAIPGVNAAFLQRCPGIDVATDRTEALVRLWAIHRATANALGFDGLPFSIAEQVHDNKVAVISGAPKAPIDGADGMATRSGGHCLAIYVADCAAVFLADRRGRAIALVHSGRKGTELGIVPAAIAAMKTSFDIPPAELVIQLSPCIRPPHYEVDFAAEIVRQARAAGVTDVHDAGTCTASHPEKYYSYRREMGRTGRMLALLALRT